VSKLFRSGVTLEQLQESGDRTMVEHLGIELTELGDDFLCGRMKVDARTCQPMRILHGGASVALAETLASVAANAIVDPAKAACVGQEINANHLRRAPEGTWVFGRARAFHVGSQSQVWGVEIVNEIGQRVCISRVTMAVLRR
jgi:1,4-dihydroxy-2-naphthoyl-CoA hydrolase